MMHINRLLPVALVFVLVTAFWSNISYSAPSVSVKTKYYDIKGTSASELRRQMRRRGPQGYWALAIWNVRWSGRCKLSVSISYTYPRWSNEGTASSALRKKWGSMLKNLIKHEKGHGQFGINAAKEIEKSRCRTNPKTIIKKWARKDVLYDRRTDHGGKFGVKL